MERSHVKEITIGVLILAFFACLIFGIPLGIKLVHKYAAVDNTVPSTISPSPTETSDCRSWSDNFDADADKELLTACGHGMYDGSTSLTLKDDAQHGTKEIFHLERDNLDLQRYYTFSNISAPDYNADGMHEIVYYESGWSLTGATNVVHLWQGKWYSLREVISVDSNENVSIKKIYSSNTPSLYSISAILLETMNAWDNRPLASSLLAKNICYTSENILDMPHIDDHIRVNLKEFDCPRLAVKDFDNDGHLDFAAPVRTTVSNVVHGIWLYNPAADLFTKIGEVPEEPILYSPGIISVTYKGGNQTWISDTYSVSLAGLVLRDRDETKLIPELDQTTDISYKYSAGGKNLFEIRLPKDTSLSVDTRQRVHVELNFMKPGKPSDHYVEMGSFETDNPVCGNPLGTRIVSTAETKINGVAFHQDWGEEGTAGTIYHSLAYTTRRDGVCLYAAVVYKFPNTPGVPLNGPYLSAIFDGLVEMMYSFKLL